MILKISDNNHFFNYKKLKPYVFFPGLDYTDIEMVGQCFEFYRSVVTENTLITVFLARKLAENPDIQERLREEMIKISSHVGNGGLTYELVNDMKYSEMVITEGFRMCPIATELKRRATKPYVFENSNEAKVAVKPGDGVWIPAFILQNDPEYYPAPNAACSQWSKLN